LIKRYGLNDITDFDIRYRAYNVSNHTKNDLVKIAVTLEDCLKGCDFQMRAELNFCSIFTNSKDTVELIQNRLKKFVIEVWGPENDNSEHFLLSNKNKIICKKLPRNNYRFKVFFKNGHVDLDKRNCFLNWCQKFTDGRIHIPESTRKSLEGSDGYNGYFYGQYFYVKDSKIATMALMLMGDCLNKTEEYVLKDEILTNAESE
jgi:hypothetical protein